MKKKFLSALVFTFALLCCTILFSCNNGSLTINEQPITINGFNVNSIRVFQLPNGYCNFEVGLTNKNEQPKEFDFSKFELKLNDETILQHNGNTSEYNSNQYYKWTFQINSAKGTLSIGDSIKVYYNSEFLKTITVEEF